MTTFLAQKNRTAILSASLLAGVGLFALSLPADGQESLLPPGFDQPAQPKAEPKPKPKGDSAPKAEPKSDGGSDSRPAPSQSSSGSGSSGSGSTGSSSDSSGSSSSSTSSSSSSSSSVSSSSSSSASASKSDDEEDANDEITRVRKYDLPAGSRRSLDRIGPLSAAEGGLGEYAYSGAGGHYLSILMDKTQAPLVSRWGSILLRRALLSSANTPTTINGADFAASRAALLVRMGEADAARAMIQSVDPDKATPKLLAAAMETYTANADPAGLCPLVPMGLQRSKDGKWELARGICTALSGDAGTAGVIIDRALRQKKADPIDVRLAEKILGSAVNGRRAVKIEWDGVDTLTPWRFGLATATGVDIPAKLMNNAPAATKSWQVMAPMAPLNTRMVYAPFAAQTGVLSNNGYVDLLSGAFADDEANEKVSGAGDTLKMAYVGKTLGERLTAIKKIWADADAAGDPYSGEVLTARAAARLPVTDEVGEDVDRLVASMLTAGLDVNAAAWSSVVSQGSDAWAMLAVGAPQPLQGVDAGAVDDFVGNDDSDNYLKSKIFVAGLAGLGRIEQSALTEAANDLEMNFNGKSSWAVAIEKAAADGQAGTVALLAAVGLQGDSWGRMDPAHIYFITKSLREVGLNAEARMIAAEAVARS